MRDSAVRAWAAGDRIHPLLAEREDVKRASDAHEAAASRMRGLDDEHRAAVQVWEAQAADAIMDGREPPPRPVEMTPAMRQQLGERARLLGEKVEAVQRTVAGEVRVQLEERMVAIYAEVRELWARIGAFGAELGALGLAAQVLDTAEGVQGSHTNLAGELDARTVLEHANRDLPTFGVPRRDWQEWRARGLVR